MKTFTSDRETTDRKVWVRHIGPPRELLAGPSQKVINHSPDGFEWGYSGSGPAQLALAILMDVYPVEIAQRFYQEFKSAFIAPADKDGFTILEEDVRQFIVGRLAAAGGV